MKKASILKSRLKNSFQVCKTSTNLINISMKIISTSKLIKQIMEEDYSNAKESLQTIINQKLKDRISTCLKDLKENSK